MDRNAAVCLARKSTLIKRTGTCPAFFAGSIPQGSGSTSMGALLFGLHWTMAFEPMTAAVLSLACFIPFLILSAYVIVRRLPGMYALITLMLSDAVALLWSTLDSFATSGTITTNLIQAVSIEWLGFFAISWLILAIGMLLGSSTKKGLAPFLSGGAVGSAMGGLAISFIALPSAISPYGTNHSGQAGIGIFLLLPYLRLGGFLAGSITYSIVKRRDAGVQ